MGQIKVLKQDHTCAGCGAEFQSTEPLVPGFIPESSLEQQKALRTEGGVEDPEESLIGTGSISANDFVFCQRCFRLRNYGKVENELRPGWTSEASLMPSHFEKLLAKIQYKKCILVAIVDVFDFHGSMLPDIAKVAGNNRVVVAVNKADLLPWADDHSTGNMLRSYIRKEAASYGLKDLGGQNIHLVSAKTGEGVQELFDTVRRMALASGCNVYVVGAANVGKSSLLNKLMKADGGSSNKGKKPSSKKMPVGITASNLPGTTLSFVEISFGRGVRLFDTPGIILPHQLTLLLTPDELKQVVPHSLVKPTTQKYGEGRCLLFGGFGRIEILEGLPFYVTSYFSNDVKIHATNFLEKDIDAFVKNNVGKILTPPSDLQRLEEIGPLETHEFSIRGVGWDDAACDIVLSGLGWVSFTGVGRMRIRVSMPKGILVMKRDPLLPSEAKVTLAKKFTGGTMARTSLKKLKKNRNRVKR